MLPVAILAGGLATRLRPLTSTIPKSLIPIKGEPFLGHQLRLLRSRGIHRVVLCVGHLGEMLEEFAGAGERHGLTVEYSWDGPIQLGTGGAIRRALPLLGDTFFVMYGDSYLPCDYGAIEASFKDSGRLGLMTVFRNEGRWDTSNVEFSGDRLVAYDKRERTPRMHHIDYGLGVFHRSAFAGPEPCSADLADVYRDLLDRNNLAAFEVSQRFYEIGSPAGIEEFERFLSAHHSAADCH